MVFRSKLKVGESYGDKGSDDEQDGEHNAENAIESVGLIESPNCDECEEKEARGTAQTLPAAKSSEISM